jgi:hypothetical protein
MPIPDIITQRARSHIDILLRLNAEDSYQLQQKAAGYSRWVLAADRQYGSLHKLYGYALA